MRAKIIADVAVIAGYFALIILWAFNVPFKADTLSSLSFGEEIAAVATILAVNFLGTGVIIYILKWIHRGK